MRKENRKFGYVACVKEAYKVIAKAWVDAGAELTEAELTEGLPEFTYEAAIEFGWAHYPLMYRPLKPVWDPKTDIRSEVYKDPEPIPDSELVERIGRFKVTAVFKAQFLAILAGPMLGARAMKYDVEAKNSAPVSKTAPARGGTPVKSVLIGNIEWLRLECGWSPKDLANEMRVDTKTVTDLLDRGAKPRPSTMKKYAEAFGRQNGWKITVADLTSRSLKRRLSKAPLKHPLKTA